MEYIFEDKYDKGIPFLYRQGYDENMLRHFHFVGGSGNIQREVSKCIHNGAEEIFIQYDLVLNNIDTWIKFNKLVDCINTFKNWHNKVVIYPIPCIEYYMIKSLHGSKIEIHPKSVEACLILQNYFEDRLIKTFGAHKRVSTHERFCKFILDKAFLKCIGGKEEVYETHPCKCSTPLSATICDDISMADKSRQLLKAFEIIPVNNIVGIEGRLLSFEELKQLSINATNRIVSLILNFYNSDEIGKTRDLPELHYRR